MFVLVVCLCVYFTVCLAKRGGITQAGAGQETNRTHNKTDGGFWNTCVYTADISLLCGGRMAQKEGQTVRSVLDLFFLSQCHTLKSKIILLIHITRIHARTHSLTHARTHARTHTV